MQFGRVSDGKFDLKRRKKKHKSEVCELENEGVFFEEMSFESIEI